MMRRSRQVTMVLGVALAAGVVSCRDSQPAGMISAPATANRREASEEAMWPAPRLVSCPAHGSATASAVVGASGGVIHVGGDQLVIPAGALDDQTLITATIPADTLADIQFQPHGLQFDKPALLVLSTAGCKVGSGNPSHVDYLDDDGNVLEVLNATPAGGGVATHIGHFSSYAVAF